MSFVALLRYGPELYFAHEMIAKTSGELTVETSPIFKGAKAIDLIDRMQTIFDRKEPIEKSRYLETEGSGLEERLCMKTPVESQDTVYSLSPTETNAFYLPQQRVVVFTRGFKFSNATYPRFDIITFSSQDATRQLARIYPIVQKWFSSVYRTLLRPQFLSTLAIVALAYGAPNTLLTRVSLLFAQAIVLPTSILFAYRIFQIFQLQCQIAALSDFGQLAARVRQWTYQYPSLPRDASNKFLTSLEVEKFEQDEQRV